MIWKAVVKLTGSNNDSDALLWCNVMMMAAGDFKIKDLFQHVPFWFRYTKLTK